MIVPNRGKTTIVLLDLLHYIAIHSWVPRYY